MFGAGCHDLLCVGDDGLKLFAVDLGVGFVIGTIVGVLGDDALGYRVEEGSKKLGFIQKWGSLSW